MKIVIDKSYLQGANSEEVKNLCKNNDVLMPESLFYELLTTEPDVRARCFKKVPQIDNPFILVPNVGNIIRFEVHNKACSDISEIAIDVQYEFNKNLMHPKFTPTHQQQKDLIDWEMDIKSRVEGFQEKSVVVSSWFPDTKGFKAGSDPSPIDEAKSIISTDKKFVRNLYDQIKHKTFPDSSLIDENWALFRWVQVHILAALDYMRSYGDGNSVAISKKIENEFLDLDYCITASLFGGLASKDKGMINRFKSICPNGCVIS